jgi:hypothetical protein
VKDKEEKGEKKKEDRKNSEDFGRAGGAGSDGGEGGGDSAHEPLLIHRGGLRRGRPPGNVPRDLPILCPGHLRSSFSPFQQRQDREKLSSPKPAQGEPKKSQDEKRNRSDQEKQGQATKKKGKKGGEGEDAKKERYEEEPTEEFDRAKRPALGPDRG